MPPHNVPALATTENSIQTQPYRKPRKCKVNGRATQTDPNEGLDKEAAPISCLPDDGEDKDDHNNYDKDTNNKTDMFD